MKLGFVAGLALLSVAAVTRTAAASGELFENGYLFAGQSLVGSSCYVHLDMQSDGNLVLYYGSQAAWATNTVGSGAYAEMQTDGNFVVYNWNNNPVFATGSNRVAPDYLNVQNDGNLVVYDYTNVPQWASNTFLGEPIGQTCTREESDTYVEENVNRAGGDYTSIQIDRNWPEACAYWCAQDSRCVAFTHVPMGVQGPNPVCWLKSSLPGATAVNGMTSGLVNRSVP